MNKKSYFGYIFTFRKAKKISLVSTGGFSYPDFWEVFKLVVNTER